MNIELSPKYKPLFELLECWNVINAPDFDSKSLEFRSKWVALSEVDTVVIGGGRDSGKSHAETLQVVVAAKDYGHRVLFTRYTMNSTDHSISQALTERMETLGATTDFEYANNTFQSRDRKGHIYITGQKTSSLNQTAKLKSLENFSMFVTDEADEQKTFEEWDKIRKSIRARDVQCLNVMVFNPPTKAHFIYTEFFEDAQVKEGFNGIKDNVLYIHTTYKDNLKFIAPHNLRDYQKLERSYDDYECMTKAEQEVCDKKIKKEWSKYKHVVLGGFLDVAEGVIYEDWIYGDFDESLPFARGLDFGYNDPDAMVKVAIDEKRKRMYVKEEIFNNNNGTDTLAKLILSHTGTDGLVIADAASARLITDLYRDYGINVLRAKKGKDSVTRGISKIQSYTIVVAPNSPNVVKGLNNYHWVQGGKNVAPHHDFSDIMDAMRYGATYLFS
jgi:phage terminase large subunit